jgi:cyanophycin synthetase
VLTELRFLDGPNLYFPRPAVKLTLDLSSGAALDAAAATRLARSVGLRVAQPGDPDSGQRQLVLERVARAAARRVAVAAGTTRLALRIRAGTDPASVVLAYPWRHRGRAQAFGDAVAALLEELIAAALAGQPSTDFVAAAGARVAATDPGPAPDLPAPRIRVVSVTGTNGKTTVTRLLAHLSMTAGLRTGWTNTDGIYLAGELVEAGDWSGPGGARRVLVEPRLQVAVLETARGGLLLRGMGVAHNDVSVVTNVTADHLGLQGVETLDQLAEVKAIIVGVTRASGWTVLNGDDPRTFAMRAQSKAKAWVFSLDPASPSLRVALDEGGRGATVLDGDLVMLAAGAEPDHLLALVDVPLTLLGLSAHNVANALAAAAAGLGLGLPRAAVVEGLRTFQPDAMQNPGRMNLFDLNGVTVIVDLAHNEAGLEALLQVMTGLRAPDGSTRLVLGIAGDRQDDVLVAVAAMGVRGADDVVIGHKERYLRGRTTGEMAALYRAGAADVGVLDLAEEPTELAGLRTLLARSVPGDVVAVMCHAEREEIYAWLAANGAHPTTPSRGQSPA